MIKKLFKFLSIFVFTTLLPLSVFAQGFLPSRQTVPLSTASNCIATNQLGYILCTVRDILNGVLPVLLALGVVYFVWGVVQYFIGDSEEAKTKGKDKVIYGIIGLTVILSLWGLVYLIVNTFGLNASAPALQTIDGSGSACNLVNRPKLQNLMGYVGCVINNSIIPLIFTLAVAMFTWGAVKFFIINSGEEEKREQGKQFMIWAVIALAVMVSVWGLVRVVGGTFNLNTSVLPQVKP